MSSPSEFLTFYRRTVLSSRSMHAPSTLFQPARAIAARPFSLSASYKKDYPEDLSTNSKTKTDQYPDDEHSTDKVKKGNDLDVGSSNVKGGMDSAKKSGTGGHATEQRDSAGGIESAKRTHPEAPDPAIGMQDERGGRGA